MAIAIKLEKVSKTFKLPHEKQSSVKSIFVSMFRGRRTYERQRVLKSVSFDIEAGEFFGIVGRNGSGKSTLLKLLAGIYTPDKGHVHVNGQLTPFIELGVGFSPELTGRENVYLNGALLGFNRKEMNALYDEIVAFAELEKFMDQKLKNYSSGMQVRLAFSIAIRAKSDILLLDEVLAVGDAAFQQKCYDYFEELKRKRQTVVFVSHDMGAVRRFCTKAAYVENGKLVHLGSPAEIADIYLVNNIENAGPSAKSDDKKAARTPHKISAKVSAQTDDTVKLKFAYKSGDKEKLYVGISLLRDGMSIAEISTDPAKPFTGSGSVAYTLDTAQLNGGVYEVACALFTAKNRRLVAVGDQKATFTIKGGDITRGAALKLADTWEQKR